MKIGLTASDLKRVAWSGAFAFLAVFLPLATGQYKNFSDAKAAALALVPAALAALFSVVKNGLLADGSPLK